MTSPFQGEEIPRLKRAPSHRARQSWGVNWSSLLTLLLFRGSQASDGMKEVTGVTGSWKTVKRKGLPKENLEHLMILPDSLCCSQRASVTAIATDSCNSCHEMFTPCQELNIAERMNIGAKCLISTYVPFSPQRSKLD